MCRFIRLFFSGAAIVCVGVCAMGGIIVAFMAVEDGDWFVASARAAVGSPTPSPTAGPSASASATRTPGMGISPSPTESPTPKPIGTHPRFTPIEASPSPTPEASRTPPPTPAPTEPVWIQDGEARTLEALKLRNQWTALTAEEQIRLREFVPGVEIEGTTVTLRLAEIQKSEDAIVSAIVSVKDRYIALQDRLTALQVFHGKQRKAAVALTATLPTPTPEVVP